MGRTALKSLLYVWRIKANRARMSEGAVMIFGTVLSCVFGRASHIAPMGSSNPSPSIAFGELGRSRFFFPLLVTATLFIVLERTYLIKSTSSWIS